MKNYFVLILVLGLFMVLTTNTLGQTGVPKFLERDTSKISHETTGLTKEAKEYLQKKISGFDAKRINSLLEANDETIVLIDTAGVLQLINTNEANYKYYKNASKLDTKKETEKNNFFLYASGNVKSLVSDPNAANSAASGSVGFSYINLKHSFTAFINVASNIDTLDSGFSSLILTPATGKALSSFLFEYKYRYGKYGFLKPYFAASASNWKNNDTTEVASIIAVGGLWGMEKTGVVANNTIDLSFELGFAYRHVGGDIKFEKEFYKNLLGTDKNSFLGIELGARIGFNHVSAEFTGYYFGGQLKGVSDLQFIASISVASAIFKGKL